jgi:hypothetical protein
MPFGSGSAGRGCSGCSSSESDSVEESDVGRRESIVCETERNYNKI